MTQRSTDGNNPYQQVVQLTDGFARQEGRRPRILIAMSENEPGDRYNEICNNFADFGFDVDVAPRLFSVDGLNKQAIENDVHILLILAKKKSGTVLIDKMVKGLNEYGRNDILLAVKILDADQGGQDHNSGLAYVFGAATKTTDMAKFMLTSFIENK